MNIFLLDVIAALAANYHCDKHCIKMILETTQLLYTAWWFGRDHLDLPELDPCPWDPYRPTHQNHPSAIWARADPAHYHWLLKLGYALCKEFYERYGGKFHKCMDHLDRLQAMGAPPHVGIETYQPPTHKCATTGLPDGIKFFHCAINDEVWDPVYTDGKLNAVETYRRYYKTKSWGLKWYRGLRGAPNWYRPVCEQVSTPTVQACQHNQVSNGSDIAFGALELVSAI